MDVYQETQFFFDGVQTEKRIIGKSVFGRKIYACKVGDGYPVGIVQYAIHGREWITAKLAFAHFFRGVAKGSVWIIPLANPDGALLSQTGISSVSKKMDAERLISLNNGDGFSLWKANGRGVDLNVNFPALWGKGAKNVFTAGAENFVGTKPFSEPETVALRDFTLKVKPNYTVSYHTKGEEIYWYFYQSMRNIARDKALALAVSNQTGYPLKHAKNSVGGYKDWCVQTLKIPAITIEAGKDEYPHPLGENAFDDILQKNLDVLYTISKEYK